MSDMSTMDLRRELTRLLEECNDIAAAVIATSDGHALEGQARDGKLPAKQLATMSSTLLALGDSVAKLLEQGLCRNVLVENGEGTAMVLPAGDGVVLMTAAARDATLGTVLSHSRKAAESIAQLPMFASKRA